MTISKNHSLHLYWLQKSSYVGAQYKRLTERDAMETNAIQSGEIRLDPKMMKVWVNEKEVHLKKKEFQLLEFLMRIAILYLAKRNCTLAYGGLTPMVIMLR